MKHISRARSVAVVIAWLCMSGYASAQQNCPAGVAANGECADPSIIDSMRETAVIFSQPNISYTAFPILPTGDLQYRYPNQLIPNQGKPAAAGSAGTYNPSNPSIPSIPSDVRLKRDIVLLAHLDNGIGLYRFRYKWSDTYYVGVMAQEAMKVLPSAVVQGADGYLRVDYARIGLKFQTWDEWLVHPKASVVTVGR